ncbi:threonine--tRNA ligase [Spiroplasma endosymbiont of Nebria brevicollis]|uniref:threonine--tRNA ligase n=1 Tax=Spiroplasma endosymbiont of Nebria brevicollis TaxID=3066284 RepID=UPI00313AB6E1
MKINVNTLDGKLKSYHLDQPVTGYELLLKDDAKQAASIIAFTLNGQLKDLHWKIKEDAEVKFVTKNETLGWTVLNYGCAMVLAHAIKIMYPKALITVAKTNDDGFYLDFDYSTRLTNEDLVKIEKQMHELLKNNLTVARVCQTQVESLKSHSENPFALEYIKLNHVNGLKCSYLVDNKTLVVASGVAINETKSMKAFKLLNITGAYWLGNDKNKQLQRITGICHYSKDQLQAVIKDIEDRKNRDHRKLGKELNIFTFNDDCGKGLPIFLPNGMMIKKILQSYLREQEFKWEYQEVATPVLGSVELYKKTGHWDHYRENMFSPTEKEGEQLVLRPMTCPHHCMIYKSVPRSYRDLPLRLSEHALLYRYEASGALTGLERVRSMELTDSHIFVRRDQMKEEFKRCYQLIAEVLKTLNIKIDYLSLSLRDPADKEKYFNDNKMWVEAETALREVLDELKLDYKPMIGEAAFYGPKFDVQIKTALGHEITISTIQFDFLLPRKFNLTYIDQNNHEVNPVIVHRGLIGTYERFIATLLEQTKGVFPLWLSPTQIAILPINDTQPMLEYANLIHETCKQNNIRTEIISSGTISKRIAEAQTQKVPYQIVVGQKELNDNKISYRQYGQKESFTSDLISFLKLLVKQVNDKK